MASNWKLKNRKCEDIFIRIQFTKEIDLSDAKVEQQSEPPE